MSTLARTQQLLLCCCRRVMSAEDRARALSLIGCGISWPALAEQAQVNGLAPLVFYNLRSLGAASQVPAAVWRQFEDNYYSTLGDNLLLETELLKVARCLQARDIDFLLLKGMVLGRLLYPDPALRPSTDLDIMVHAGQVPAARQALADLGYVLQPGRQLDFQLSRSYDLPFVRETSSGQPVLLELHWNIAERDLFDLDVPAFWQRSRPFSWHDLELRSLSLEDVLLHLIIHIRKHRYVGLRWLVDVSELLRTYGDQLNWSYLVSTARRGGAGTLLYTTLNLARDTMDAPTPTRELRPLRPGPLRRLLIRPFVGPANLTRVVAENSAEWSWLGLGQVLLLDRVRTMGLDLVRRLAPPIDIFPERETRPRGALADARFYVGRAATIGGRIGRSAGKQTLAGLRRVWRRAVIHRQRKTP